MYEVAAWMLGGSSKVPKVTCGYATVFMNEKFDRRSGLYPSDQENVLLPMITSLSNCLSFSSPALPDDYITIIPGRLYWASLPSAPAPANTKDQNVYYFTTDIHLVYSPFFHDFGPLNLGLTYRFCKLLEERLSCRALSDKQIVYFSSTHPHKRANAAYFICAFQVIVLGVSPEVACKPFLKLREPLEPFRDASCGVCTYKLTLSHCIGGLHYAMKLKWFDYETFDCKKYEYYEKLSHGDVNWIIPDKFLAFSSPVDRDDICRNGFHVMPKMETYVKILKGLKVKTIIRLNKKQYDRKKFTAHGFNHHDIYFLDGSCPSLHIIRRFLSVCEDEKSGIIAVHCKAGLGRTGSLIGCYAIKHYRFPPALWIAWNRICRPGSILGPQQQYLHQIQDELMELSVHECFMGIRGGTSGFSAITKALNQTTLEDDETCSTDEIVGQGEELVNMKIKRMDEDDNLDVSKNLDEGFIQKTNSSIIVKQSSSSGYGNIIKNSNHKMGPSSLISAAVNGIYSLSCGISKRSRDS